MTDSFKKVLLVGLCVTMFSELPVKSSDMIAPLRKADQLYQNGRYEQAIEIANKFIEFAPDSLEAMVILGMAHFNLGNYLEAKQWFRKILKKKQKNIIANQYLELIREIEHRYGLFSINIDLTCASKDPLIAEQAFKKAWFGHGFPKESEPTRQFYNCDKNTTASITLEIKAPKEKMLIEQSIAQIAQDAFVKKLFVKSYLLYSQLLAVNPENHSYLFGKAESAFMLQRYDEVIKLLAPVMLLGKETSFTPQELKKAKDLINKSRNKIGSLK